MTEYERMRRRKSEGLNNLLQSSYFSYMYDVERYEQAHTLRNPYA